MPVGTFIPFDPADLTPRFFARPTAFECECPRCGRLFLVGPRKRDNHAYDRVTGMLTCRINTRAHGQSPGCGMKFLIGMVAWPLTTSPVRGRPFDHRPTARQLAELRQAARGIWPTKRKRRGDPVNHIEPPIDDVPEGI